MCGICGLVFLDGSGVPDPAALASMSETLVHRGPDSAGHVVAGPAGLAARRLSIIDLEHGDQPITNEDASVHAVQNGEILNYSELREQLIAEGHRLSTDGDTEVIVHLYERDGPAFVERLRGMFAIALWDDRRGRLVLARDRFGIKPLVYAADRGRLAFASELRALLRLPGFEARVDADALEAYLAFNSVPGPLTILEGVRKLPPGHVLVVEPGGEPSLRRYARPAPPGAGETLAGAGAELADELAGLLRESVAAHLVADVEVGVLLSGGIDSSLLTAFAAEHAGGRLRTFSIGFEEASFDELDQARTIARRFDTDHRELVLRPDAVGLLPRLVEAFDEPFGDSSALPTYLVSALAAEDVKVVLSGEGGDELFGGYYTYVADLLARWLGVPARLARPLVERLPSSDEKVSFDYKAKRFARAAHLPPLERHHAWKEILSPEARAEVRAGAHTPADPLARLRARYAETAGAERLARLQDVDLGTYLVDDLLTKTDRASMAHSLEARVPYCDAAVAGFALALPRRARVRGLSKKRLLRRVAADLLPAGIATAPKRGFAAPIGAWLRGEMREYARDVLSPETLRRQGLLDPAAVTRMLDRHERRQEDLSRQIWGLLALTGWHDAHLGGRAPAAV